MISARIDGLVRTPRTAMLPGQASNGDGAASRREASSTLAADRPVEESVRRRVRGECPECGDDSPGGALCGGCLGWPRCEPEHPGVGGEDPVLGSAGRNPPRRRGGHGAALREERQRRVADLVKVPATDFAKHAGRPDCRVPPQADP
ncbi:hypothetical protein GCM10010377_72900 [Streptomyces viridiviolaceus]|nr:hypothetical protein GCM10010377_72900 [Streptomyces viridiviolaceus]